jgi:ABC-type enterochelin transport system permease subunit
MALELLQGVLDNIAKILLQTCDVAKVFVGHVNIKIQEAFGYDSQNQQRLFGVRVFLLSTLFTAKISLARQSL